MLGSPDRAHTSAKARTCVRICVCVWLQSHLVFSAPSISDDSFLFLQATGKDVDVPFTFIAAKFHEFYENKLKDVEEAID